MTAPNSQSIADNFENKTRNGGFKKDTSGISMTTAQAEWSTVEELFAISQKGEYIHA